MSVSFPDSGATSVKAPWQRDLAQAIRDPDQLCDLLKLDDAFRGAAREAVKEFSLLVPQSYLNRMAVGDPDDPLLKQVLPLQAELETIPGFTADPVHDDDAAQLPGLLQKYSGRALLITTGACAIHCRYCFRRHFPYQLAPRKLEDWRPAFQWLRRNPSIHEILLSGGDPLTLSDERLSGLLSELEAIPHLSRLRIHTRLPVVLPSRVTSTLAARIAESRFSVWIVIHANHSQEMQADCVEALTRLKSSGATILNQAVLLKGINDSFAAQLDLCERLIDLGIVPYYLHQLDRVAGAAHFEVSADLGREITRELRKHLPGYAIPQYVREVAGAASKTPIELL